MKKIFNISDEEIKNAKEKLYPISTSFYKLTNEVDDANSGLFGLLQAVKVAKEASLDNPIDRHYIEYIKNEFDKIAYLIENFVNEFEPIYEELTPIYVAEKLAGTFEKKEYMLTSNGNFSTKALGWKKHKNPTTL